MNKQNTLDLAFKLISNFEGFRSQAYQDQGGVWTLGYGMTSIDEKPVKSDDTITQEQAEFWLRNRILEDYNKLELYFSMNNITINDPQAASILSFAFNVGFTAFQNSSVAQALVSNDLSKIPECLLKWCNVNKTFNQGLYNRREKEAEAFSW